MYYNIIKGRITDNRLIVCVSCDGAHLKCEFADDSAFAFCKVLTKICLNGQV